MKYKVLGLLSIIIFLIVLSLYWLAIGMFFIGAAFLVLKSNLSLAKAFRKRVWLYSISSLFAVILIAIAIRVFVLDIYYIPSSSMEGSLLEGDKIVVSKLHYGPRLPKSPFEIPWLNILFYINKEARASIDSIWWDYKRYNGFTKVKRNDIIVFNNTTDSKTFYIKRCMGLPGNNIVVKEGVVYNNTQELVTPVTVKYSYNIWFNNKESIEDIMQSFGLKVLAITDSLYLKETLTQQQYIKLKASTFIDSIHLINFPIKTFANNFSNEKSEMWSTNNWGSVWVPKKGESIILTSENYVRYHSLFEKFENVNIQNREGVFLLNGNKIKNYTFKHNYYFMMGDNRHNSIDSRYWGFVPKQNIIGKAVVTLYSKNDVGFKWNRIFKLIE